MFIVQEIYGVIVGNRLFAKMNNTGEILFHVFVPNCFYRNPDIFKENSK